MTHVPRGRRGLPTWSTCATPHEGYRRAARKLFESTYPDSPHGCGADALAVDKLNVASIAKLVVPIGGQEIELQQLDYLAGGLSLLRTRIREGHRFTIFDIDHETAARWGDALTAGAA